MKESIINHVLFTLFTTLQYQRTWFATLCFVSLVVIDNYVIFYTKGVKTDNFKNYGTVDKSLLEQHMWISLMILK